MELRPYGRFFDVDASGHLVNAADDSRICAPWREGVDAVIAMCASKLGTALHSLYVRGSVAHGDAIVGVSDVDCLLLITREAGEDDRAWRDALIASFPKTYPYATRLELPFRPIRDVLQAPERARTRFLLATQSACVFGEDIRPSLPRFRPDESIVFFARRLDAVALRRSYTDRVDDVEARSNAARAVLRAGAEIAMLRGAPYTRDLYPAYSLTAQILPQWERELRRTLMIGIGMSSEAADWRLLALIASQLSLYVPDALRS